MSTKVVDKKIYEQVSAWFDAHRGELVEDIKRIARIPSVSDPSNPGGPFGENCRRVLEEMLSIGREYGFCTENYEYYLGSICTENLREKDAAVWKNTVGLWNHLDVVPVGEGWSQDPFEPVEKKGYLIGRGVDDNKGPAMGMLYCMRCLRDLKLPLNYRLCLFVGCDEERGMEDMEYYTSRYPLPGMSVIADCGFPVCYGEKGILEGQAVAEKAFSGAVVDCRGGNAGNIIPDRAVLVLAASPQRLQAAKALASEEILVEEAEDGIHITACGKSCHAAFPQGGVNAIHVLARSVCGSGLLTGQDEENMRFLAKATEDFDGKCCGIAFEDEISGKLTCAGTVLSLEEGHPVLTFNIRYSVTADSRRLVESLEDFCRSENFAWRMIRDSAPNYFPKENPVVQRFTQVYNELTGEEKEPYVMGGGTYARKLPNAFAFGPGGMPRSEDDQAAELFAEGHGGAHGPDEGVSISGLVNAMKIYVCALLALNDCEWKKETEE